MFEEFVRELRNLEMSQDIRFPIDIPLDDNGYLDRTCPHSECRENFKVLFDDWRDKVPDAAAFCPKCGAKDDPKQFNTESQNKFIQEVANAYAVEILNQAMSQAARRTRTKKISTGFFDITMDVSYHAGPTPVVLPSSARRSHASGFPVRIMWLPILDDWSRILLPCLLSQFCSQGL